MDMSLEDLKEILFNFGRHISPNTADEDIEEAAEEYIETHEEKFLTDYENFRTED
jgi:hypothetical protein